MEIIKALSALAMLALIFALPFLACLGAFAGFVYMARLILRSFGVI